MELSQNNTIDPPLDIVCIQSLYSAEYSFIATTYMIHLEWAFIRSFHALLVGANLEIKDVHYSWCLIIMEMGEPDHSENI